MSLIEKLKKNSTLKETEILSNSKYFQDKNYIDTGIPMLNVALSGKLDGGWSSGLTFWAAPSKHFKSAFTLTLARAFQRKYKDGVVIFYDSEFGTPNSYFSSLDIDKNRVLHCPITNIEEFKFDIMQQLDGITRGEKVAIIVDSVGNLASKKELDDALEGHSAQDMTRAKQFKGLWRMLTPHLTIKDIPMSAINHVYDEQGPKYPKKIMGGGQGGILSADAIFFINKQQEKKEKELIGSNFDIIAEKSRYIKEQTKIGIMVSFENGIERWSGLLDNAIDAKLVDNSTQGWYSKIIDGKPTNKLRASETNNKEFWSSIITDPVFKTYIKDKYCLSEVDLLSNDAEEGEDE